MNVLIEQDDRIPGLFNVALPDGRVIGDLTTNQLSYLAREQGWQSVNGKPLPEYLRWKPKLPYAGVLKDEGGHLVSEKASPPDTASEAPPVPSSKE